MSSGAGPVYSGSGSMSSGSGPVYSAAGPVYSGAASVDSRSSSVYSGSGSVYSGSGPVYSGSGSVDSRSASMSSGSGSGGAAAGYFSLLSCRLETSVSIHRLLKGKMKVNSVGFLFFYIKGSSLTLCEEIRKSRPPPTPPYTDCLLMSLCLYEICHHKGRDAADIHHSVHGVNDDDLIDKQSIIAYY